MEATKEKAVIEPLESIEAGSNSTGDPDNFFAVSSKDREAEMKKFIQELGAPKEKMEDADTSFMDDEEDAPGASEMSEEEKEMAGFLDTSETHKDMARMGLMVLDKIIAFIGGMISGMDSDRYKRAKKPDEYEIEVTAAMIKKYQVHMSLEWMFAMAIVGAYTPAFQKAFADRKVMQAAREKQRRQEEFEMMARNVRQN